MCLTYSLDAANTNFLPDGGGQLRSPYKSNHTHPSKPGVASQHQDSSSDNGPDSLITTSGTCLQAWGEVRSGYTGNHGNEALFVPIQFFSCICSFVNFVAFEISVLQIRCFLNFFSKKFFDSKKKFETNFVKQF